MTWPKSKSAIQKRPVAGDNDRLKAGHEQTPLSTADFIPPAAKMPEGAGGRGCRTRVA